MEEKVTKGEKSKQFLIEKSAELFLKNGYYNTGLSQILKECNLTKGSFYFYFKSKDELGVAVADYYGETICQWFEQCLTGANTYREFIHNIVSDIFNGISEGKYYGCPYTCFATETAGQVEEIAESCRKAIDNMLSIFTKGIQLDGHSPADAKKSAGKALGIYEGFLVYYRIVKDESIIRQMEETLLDII